MDPWLSCQGDVIIQEIPITKFEDNFTVREIITNEKLPDSEEYIALLESKLKKLKNDPSVLAQLAAKREACMQRLLSNGVEQTYIEGEEIDLEKPVFNNQLIRTIAPQKQALNQGEVIELIKYDQLQVESDAKLKEEFGEVPSAPTN